MKVRYIASIAVGSTVAAALCLALINQEDTTLEEVQDTEIVAHQVVEVNPHKINVVNQRKDNESPEEYDYSALLNSPEEQEEMDKKAESNLSKETVTKIQTLEIKDREVTYKEIPKNNVTLANLNPISTEISYIDKVQKSEEVDTTGMVELGMFTATAYDLGFDSCEKLPGDEYYGRTANNTNLVGHTRESAMVVAVDKTVIPLGTKLYIEFADEYESFTGIYTAADVGGAIKGNKIDVFMGDFDSIESHPSTKAFGKQYPSVYIVD